jgi:hypothetical protein
MQLYHQPRPAVYLKRTWPSNPSLQRPISAEAGGAGGEAKKGLYISYPAFTPLPAEAQESPRTSVEGVPIVGFTLDGLQIIGTFELKGFSSAGDELRAFGELDATHRTLEGPVVTHEDVEVTVPLKILLATCESLYFEIGPFPQLGEQHPLQLHVDPGDGVLRRSSFCNIARAV